MQTGLIHPDPWAPALETVPVTKDYRPQLDRPYCYWLGRYYRRATLVYECVHQRLLPTWHKNILAFHDGNVWNTSPTNIYLPHIRPRGRPRKNRMQPEPSR